MLSETQLTARQLTTNSYSSYVERNKVRPTATELDFILCHRFPAMLNGRRRGAAVGSASWQRPEPGHSGTGILDRRCCGWAQRDFCDSVSHPPLLCLTVQPPVRAGARMTIILASNIAGDQNWVDYEATILLYLQRYTHRGIGNQTCSAATPETKKPSTPSPHPHPRSLALHLPRVGAKEAGLGQVEERCPFARPVDGCWSAQAGGSGTATHCFGTRCCPTSRVSVPADWYRARA